MYELTIHKTVCSKNKRQTITHNYITTLDRPTYRLARTLIDPWIIINYTNQLVKIIGFIKWLRAIDTAFFCELATYRFD